jgi:methionyl-tRNA formyltransferase
VTEKEAGRVILVTGHQFGINAFEGLLSSPAYLEGRIEVPLVIGLDAGLAGGTVGYRSVECLGLPFVNTTDGRLTSLAGTIDECRPHYVLVIGWSRLVAPDVLAIPGHGCIGMHPTKLPLGRGQAPIPWTIIKGMESTALSVFFLEAAADTGSVIAQYDLAVHPRETAASLFGRIAVTHFTAGYDLGEGIATRTVTGTPQDPAAATVWGRRRPADGEITADLTHAQVDALVRALLGPYPRAFVTVDGHRQEICAVEPAGASGRADRIRFTCRDADLDLVPAESKTTS